MATADCFVGPVGGGVCCVDRRAQDELLELETLKAVIKQFDETAKM